MPELPEVETIVTSLQNLPGKRIIKAENSDYRMRFPAPANFISAIQGAQLVSVTRLAKYILLNLTTECSIVIHLGMSGKILLNRDQPQKHDHLLLVFDDNSRLALNDARRFGLYTLVANDILGDHVLFKNLGMEPLSPEFNANYMIKKCKTKTIPIKVALMTNQILVGVGNIYASESLFRAKIHPLRPANTITLAEFESLCIQICYVLEDAIKAGGSTLRDYVRSDGTKGYFQQQLNVYGRAKQPCRLCNAAITGQKVAGRATFYCSNCQT